MTEIPSYLEQQITGGKAVLILGAGASIGAVDPNGKRAPKTDELRDLLAEKFLGGKLRNRTLSQVAEYAISESSLMAVQEFIRQQFDQLQPTDAHKLLPTFRWWGLATTNYDRLIEVAYAGAPPASELAVATEFRDRTTIPSRNVAQFLTVDADYLAAIAVTHAVLPTDFYKGFNPGFSAIEQQLDVRRGFSDQILTDVFLADESEHAERTELVLIKAHAGAGKTVLMRRLAWDAAHEYDCLCLFMKPTGIINVAALEELLELCRKRIYLFVDDAADRVRELESLLQHIGPTGRHLTIVAAERINEWNVSCQSIDARVTDVYELRYLTSPEIDALLALLAKHKAEGELRGRTLDQKKEAFEERAGRQLLVALHEATLGAPFRDIVKNEFDNIWPLEAQQIYLTICALNRLNVPVRAGVISRIHGVPFDEFKVRMFQPLEHIVHAEFDEPTRDYMYRARHPHIAQMIFDSVLTKEEDRFECYMRCLSALDIDYTSDRIAFRHMTRARTVLERVVSVEFSPIETQERGGSLSVKCKLPERKAAVSCATLPLTGTGFAPRLRVAPTAVDFGSQLVDTTSTVRTLMLTAGPDATVKVSNVSPSGDFAATPNSCQLERATACTISVTFAPKQLGATTGSITITNDSTSTAKVVALTGKGVARCNELQSIFSRSALASLGPVLTVVFLYLLGLVLVRWNMVALPTRRLLQAQVEAVKKRVEALTPVGGEAPSGMAQIAALLTQAEHLSRGQSALNRAADYFFWTRGQELASWGYVHEAEERLVSFLPVEAVRAALEQAEIDLRQAATPPALTLADRVREALSIVPPQRSTGVIGWAARACLIFSACLTLCGVRYSRT